jgi:hypothetical protein
MHELFPEDGFDDDDGAEGASDLDPELLEKLDKEVEDFARRLNANWRSPLAEAAAAKASAPRPEPNAVAVSVQSLLSRLLQGAGLAAQLQVRAPAAAARGTRWLMRRVARHAVWLVRWWQPATKAAARCQAGRWTAARRRACRAAR